MSTADFRLEKLEVRSQKSSGEGDIQNSTFNIQHSPTPPPTPPLPYSPTHLPTHPSTLFPLLLAPIFYLLFSFFPAHAHKTQVAGDVAGIWHIDPNHNPKAGDSARVWVALTRRGGQILPLSQASCRMNVFNRPRKAGDKPLLQPALRAINAERYRGIPGANVTFPRVGLYQLELNCSPRTPGSFQPFRLTYDVTIAR